MFQTFVFGYDVIHRVNLPLIYNSENPHLLPGPCYGKLCARIEAEDCRVLRKFREAVQSDTFSISAELTLKRQTTSADIYKQIDVLGDIVDGIQITDSPWSWVQMSPIAASALILKRGVDPIPVLSCRDRNRIALQSDLIGMRAMGVTSLMLTRGHRVPKEHLIPATTVFDTTGRVIK